MEEKEILVFDSFPIGSIVVSLTDRAGYRAIGDMFEVLPGSSPNRLYYLNDTNSSSPFEWRAATPEETSYYLQGGRNVNKVNQPQNHPDKFVKNTSKYEALPYPTDKPYFKIRVVKDIVAKDIVVRGSLPDIIPSGTITWTLTDNTNIVLNRIKNKTDVVHPEGNRWSANIPSQYFEVIEEATSNITWEQLLQSHGCGVDFAIRSSKGRGKITVERTDIFICQDKEKGADCQNKQGYKYSYILSPTNFSNNYKKCIEKLYSLKQPTPTSHKTSIEREYPLTVYEVRVDSYPQPKDTLEFQEPVLIKKPVKNKKLFIIN